MFSNTIYYLDVQYSPYCTSIHHVVVEHKVTATTAMYLKTTPGTKSLRWVAVTLVLSVSA